MNCYFDIREEHLVKHWPGCCFKKNFNQLEKPIVLTNSVKWGEYWNWKYRTWYEVIFATILISDRWLCRRSVKKNFLLIKLSDFNSVVTKVSFFWDQSQDMSLSGFPQKKQASDLSGYLAENPLNSCPDSDLRKNWLLRYVCSLFNELST